MTDPPKSPKNGGDGSLCDLCGRNKKSHKIHDKEKIVWLHDDARVMEVVNRGLKIGRSATQSNGALLTVGVARGQVQNLVAGGRKAYKGKIGKRTEGAMMAMDGAFALADGIMGIIDAATASIPQERCKSCDRTFNSSGCKAMCLAVGGCGGHCKDNKWKLAADDKYFCYHICDECFGNLIN